MSYIRREQACRSCGSSAVETILELGCTPLADRLVRERDLAEDDLLAPLTLAFCDACALVQIRETVEPDVLFGADYPYYSSVSKSLLAHFKDSADCIIREQGLGAKSLVVEAASNDGYMLQNFAESGIPVLGIDPAPGPAAVAIKRGIPTRQMFFSYEVARDLRAEFPAGADVFLANNVLAHVADLNGFVRGIELALSDTGTAVIEVPYLVDLVDHCEFDTIYHQHLCYFSVSALDKLFRRHALHLNDVERTWVHGGSLRLHVNKQQRRQDSVTALLAEEVRLGVDRPDYYLQFASRARALAMRLHELLLSLKNSGHRIAGYGAAAKAATLLSFVGIDRSILDFIADRNEHKHGWFMGGNHIPIVGLEQVTAAQPDFVVLLAWNFAREIMADLNVYAERGGRFILPVPEPKIVAS